MGNVGTTSMLAGLVKGYVEGKDELKAKELSANKDTRDNLLRYLGTMANSPDVPAEHRDWALKQIPQLLQHDITKKLPKGLGDLSTLPPVTVKQPGQVQTQTLPGNAPQGGIRLPQAPGGGAGATTGPAAPPGASGDVGRASNGTVNALGAMAATPGPGAAALSPIALPPRPVPPAPPVVGRVGIPSPPQSFQVQAPDTSQQLAPGGAPHILTTDDRMQMANAAQQAQLNILQQRFPDKSPEELAYFLKHDEFEKPETADVAPGAELVDKRTGKVIARNDQPKPGTKSGFEPVMGPGGPIGIKDMATDGMLTPDEVAANPHAKAVLDQAVASHKSQLSDQEARDNRKAEVQANQQARAFAQQARMLEARGEALTANTKAMVEAVPKVQELSQRIRALVDQQEKELGPMSSRWQEFMAGKIGSPNPEFTKLRTDTGLLQTLLLKMHVGARGGQQMMSHFKELLDNSKQSPENMRAALDEIDEYAKGVKEQGESAKEATAAKAEGRSVEKPKPPDKTGATGDELPPQARAQLQEGHETTFANGQVWTLQKGTPQRLKAKEKPQ